tara:strand:+ start:904 stop:1041 length:138 start_codon:yes stop_codon:yes gene_type:complete
MIKSKAEYNRIFSNKIKILKREGYSQRQSVAIAKKILEKKNERPK